MFIILLMDREQIFEFVNAHPICQMATCEGNLPRVRHMLLYRADERGLVFHTNFDKDLCDQLFANHNVELCFYDVASITQIRIHGKAIIFRDRALSEEIVAARSHLARIRAGMGQQAFDQALVLLRIVECTAVVWTLDANFNDMHIYAKQCVHLCD